MPRRRRDGTSRSAQFPWGTLAVGAAAGLTAGAAGFAAAFYLNKQYMSFPGISFFTTESNPTAAARYEQILAAIKMPGLSREDVHAIAACAVASWLRRAEKPQPFYYDGEGFWNAPTNTLEFPDAWKKELKEVAPALEKELPSIKYDLEFPAGSKGALALQKLKELAANPEQAPQEIRAVVDVILDSAVAVAQEKIRKAQGNGKGFFA